MEFRNLLNAQNRDELRQWLLENYNKEPECWVVVKRGRPIDDETFWYMKANGYELDITDTRYHHEIYLSDPRKCDVSRLKTVVRHPIRKAE